MTHSTIIRQPNELSTKVVARLIRLAQKSLSQVVMSEGEVGSGLVFASKGHLDDVKTFMDRAMEAVDALQVRIDANALSDTQMTIINKYVGEDEVLDYAVVGDYIILKVASAVIEDEVDWVSMAIVDGTRSDTVISDTLDEALICALCARYDQIGAATYIAKMLGVSGELAA